MSNGIVINNGASGALVAPVLHLPPNALLDMGSLATLFHSMDAQSTPPPSPVEGDTYLDDGTNAQSGTMGFRRYNAGVWEDLGLQEVGDIAIDGGLF